MHRLELAIEKSIHCVVLSTGNVFIFFAQELVIKPLCISFKPPSATFPSIFDFQGIWRRASVSKS